MKRTRISDTQSNRISELESRLGDKTIRTILTGENQRLMRPERYANLVSGKAQLTEAEKERISLLSANAQRIQTLARQSEQRGNIDFKTNRALRDWIQFGKQKGAERDPNRQRELKAIKGLRYLGISGPLARGGYVRKGGK